MKTYHTQVYNECTDHKYLISNKYSVKYLNLDLANNNSVLYILSNATVSLLYLEKVHKSTHKTFTHRKENCDSRARRISALDN